MGQRLYSEAELYRSIGDLDGDSKARYDLLSYLGFVMRVKKIAVTIDQDLPARLDQLVAENQFPNRSRAVQEAIRDKLQRLQKSRLARESARLDPAFEQALVEEGLTEDGEQWPAY